jgi:phosphoheptose isomerase
MTAAPELHAVPLPRVEPTPKFPTTSFGLASAYGDGYFEEIARAAATIDGDQVNRAAELLVAAYERGSAVFACGNGGSAAVANHMQCDHVKGIRTGTDLLPRVISLSTNSEVITALANDIGYEQVFTYQLQSQSRPGDVLLAISSSGKSPNIVGAIEWARANGVHTIALTGFGGGASRTTADASIHVDSTNYGVIEDLHQATMHFLAQYIRQSRMTATTIATTTF